MPNLLTISLLYSACATNRKCHKLARAPTACRDKNELRARTGAECHGIRIRDLPHVLLPEIGAALRIDCVEHATTAGDEDQAAFRDDASRRSNDAKLVRQLHAGQRRIA